MFVGCSLEAPSASRPEAHLAGSEPRARFRRRRHRSPSAAAHPSPTIAPQLTQRTNTQQPSTFNQVRLLREELQLLQEPGSYVGEVIKVMGKSKVLVKVHPEGKYVVDVDKAVDMATLTPGARVALRNDRCAFVCVLFVGCWLRSF